MFRVPVPVEDPVAPLFSKEQIAVASFVGGMPAGVVMFAANYYRLGRTAAAVGSALLGLVITATLVLVGYFLAVFGIPTHYVVPILVALATKAIAGNVFAEEYELNEYHDVMPLSNWIVAAITVGSLALIVSIVLQAVAL